MHRNLFTRGAALFAAATFIAACGGSGSNPTDARPGQDPPPPAAGPRAFLLFPNPQQQADGVLQTDTLEYAEAYYRAIDPTGSRDSLAKWQAANGFGTGTGTEVSVVFGDRLDLGYGRRMVGRQNPDGSLAFMVENYLVETGGAYAYSPINLEAAIVRDTRWRVGVSAIEFSPHPGGGASFVKYFNFDTAGMRTLTVDVDGRGDKAMPGPCVTCHGGRGDALTPPDASGRRLFNKVQDSASGLRGDVNAKLHMFTPDTFDFSTRPGFTRADQEAAIKALNRMVLCSYPIAAPSGHPEDACRRIAGPSEWQGGAAELVKAAYGGPGLPNATFVDDHVPASWQAAGQSALYRQVVAPSCRTCHVLLGTRAQSDLDFATFEKFAGFADRTRAHVFDRGNMPLAKIVFDAFWADPVRVELLAGFVESRGHPVRDPSGAALRPGRPVAVPGPDRVVRPGPTVLSGEQSLFANAYAWSIASGPAGATLAAADSARPTFSATEPGTYTVQLVVSAGELRSSPEQLRIVVSPALSPTPQEIRFANIKAVMQSPGSCAACHAPSGVRTPVFFANVDRNGDALVNADDDAWFHEEVRSRINFTDVAASPLLRKPSGNHHNGGRLPGFDTSAAPGDPARARYDLFLNWILNGAPP